MVDLPQLPPDGATNWGGPVRDFMQAAGQNAQDSATAAQASATSSADSATEAEASRIAAEEAAAAAELPADEAVDAGIVRADIPGQVAQEVAAQPTVAAAAAAAMQDAGVVAQVTWAKGTLTANQDLNLLRSPGEYIAAPFSVSSTLLNRWDTGTGVYIVHRQSASGSPAQLIMERLVTASVSTGPVPVKRATRSMLFDGTWTPWISDADVVATAATTAVAAYVDPRLPSPESLATRITAFGDSLTDGGSNGALWPEAESWPARLGVKLGTGVTVTNAGFSGATVGELLMRIGARPVRLIVPVGGIANNGNATVQPIGEYGLSTASRSIDLTYLTKGVRLRTSSTGWILDNYTSATIPAGEITLGPSLAFSGLAADTAVIWIGINDITFATKGSEETVADHIVAGTQALVEWLSPRRKRVLILGVTPRSTETTGTAANNTVLEVNSRLRSLYPGRFRSVFQYLQTKALVDMGVTPTQADTTAVAQGVLPPSVLAAGDVGHINQAAAQVVGEHFVYDALRAQGWA